jgi:hypothetical protein
VRVLGKVILDSRCITMSGSSYYDSRIVQQREKLEVKLFQVTTHSSTSS